MDEQTSYETDPVESLSGALLAFVEAYDMLQMAIAGASEEWDFSLFTDALRLAMYRPVHTGGDGQPSISLYEIGVVYFPATGKYAVHRRKLEKSLANRGDDIQALFVQEDGLLPRLCEMLLGFLEAEPPSEVYSTAMRFLNECRRLTAMWS